MQLRSIHTHWPPKRYLRAKMVLRRLLWTSDDRMYRWMYRKQHQPTHRRLSTARFRLRRPDLIQLRARRDRSSTAPIRCEWGYFLDDSTFLWAWGLYCSTAHRQNILELEGHLLSYSVTGLVHRTILPLAMQKADL